MKQRFVVFLVMLGLCVSGTVFAQLSINKGIKAGLNVSNQRIDPDPDGLETKNGFLAGAFLEIDPLGPLSVQGEALFTQKGGKRTYSEAGDDFENTVKVNYLEIPVLAKLQVPVAPPLVSSAFYAGPAIAFKVSESESLERNGQEVDQDDENEEDIFKSSDIGAVVGANLSFSALGFAAIFMDLRYTLGLSNIAKDVPEGSDISIKNGVISLSVGLGL